MAAQPVTTYSLFGGSVQSISTSLGINQNSTVITMKIAEDGQPIVVSNRQVVDISIGALQVRGIVQSWTEAITDSNGTGIYQIRITDTKPVLDAAQVIIGSSYNSSHTEAYSYGDNVIPIVFQTAIQILNGVPFSTIKSNVESSKIKYGNQIYTVNFNFTLPNRGSAVEYSLKGRAMSLLDLISQIANDHGLNWYVSTSTDNVISINMYGRTNITNITMNQLAALHPSAIIKRHEGNENISAVQKVVLIGGYRSSLTKTASSSWQQFWGFDNDGNKRSSPIYSETVMETIINNNFTADDFTEEEASRILSYANEFWGRKFISIISPPETIGSDGRSWVTPTSAAWNTSDDLPLDFERDGQLKFQTDDGRWVTFTTLPLPGSRNGNRFTYSWDDELYSNPNSYIDDENKISMKSSLEIVDGFVEMEFWLEQFIIYLLNESPTNNISIALALFISENPDMSTVVKFDLIRLVNSIKNELKEIADGTLIYTDEVKNSFKEGFSDQYYLLTLATPLRVRTIRKVSTLNTDTGQNEISDVITKTRLQTLGDTYLALLDQRETYGPWSNGNNSIGRTEVIIDSSLTPWAFGYRGITNSVGMDLLDIVALAKIKTVADLTLDAKTAELVVAGVPAVNIGDQLNTTGAITSINITFDINGIRTTYKSLQYTNDLSKHLRRQQEILDNLRRQAAEFNNTLQPPQDAWETDRTIRTLKKELPESPVDISTEGNRRSSKQLLGRIFERSSTSEPKYNITPMAWVSDIFGELTLRRDPKVFGQYLRVVNMGENQQAAGRLLVGTDVEVKEFETTDGGITSYYIEVTAPTPPIFTATIIAVASSSQPSYKVKPTVNSIQQLNLLTSEILDLNSVMNIGEPANFQGYLSIGAEVSISWNENIDGSYTPFMEQQLNLFKPLG